MMQIEKNLAKTDLNQFKTEPIKLLFKQLYKYQDFKASVVLNKINKLTFKDNTIKTYLTSMRTYIKDGTKTLSNSMMYDYIEELKSVHTPILTPSLSERHIVNNITPKEKSIQIIQKQSVEQPKYIEKIPPQYGVMCDNKIVLQPNKEMALGYLECYRVIGDGKPAKLVAIEIEEVK